MGVKMLLHLNSGGRFGGHERSQTQQDFPLLHIDGSCCHPVLLGGQATLGVPAYLLCHLSKGFRGLDWQGKREIANVVF